jgi:hypothetical protein
MLSAHFSLEELCASQFAKQHKLDNTPGAEETANLTELAGVLERVRQIVGGPIIINSGYRSPKVNVGVKGSPNSVHMLGLAADITCEKFKPKELAQLLQPKLILLGVDQLILEPTWVHIGLPREGQACRYSTLTKTVDGVMRYGLFC